MKPTLLLLSFISMSLHAADRPHPELPLPARAEGQAGLRFVDLNGDGHEDIVFSNAGRYGVYLYNDVERGGLGWTKGWPHIIREGIAGDAHALPLTTGDSVTFADGAMSVGGVKKFTFAELCRPPAPPPRNPQESLRALHVKPGFAAELVVSEPLVQDPIFVDWGADGRMWVVEMGDYPFHERDGKTYHGRVKVLEDTNDDGVYDKATIFLDNLRYPTGLAIWKNGVFVSSVPEVFFAEDTDGDGRADKRTAILTGFAKGNPQHLVNGFSWGLDGWLYGGNGDSGGEVTDVSTGKKYQLSGDFRFHPQTGEFQPQAGRAQYGRWRDDFGNWFANNNANLGWHYFLESRYLARNPSLAIPTLRRNLNPNGTKIFPVSTPMRRLNQADLVNTLTSGCNPMPYRDSLFGADYGSSIFICEPASNLVHREVLTADGISFTSRRAVDDAQSEFLASEDHWSRFVQARTGPDGCLYVVDFYRLILEHPEWIPSQMLAYLDVRAGSDMGRIYRIRPTTRHRTTPKLAALNDEALAAQLGSTNGWVRDTAQRLLIERGAQWRSDTLSGSTAAQVQQLWTMHTLGTLKPTLLLNAMRDKDARLREHAARLAENHLNNDAVLTGLCELATDDDLRVRVQVAFSLGESRDGRISPILAALAKSDAGTPGMLIALLSSAPKHPEAAQWQAMLHGKRPATNHAPPPKIATTVNPDRAKIVKDYATVSNLTGDAGRGHPLYTALCSACHRLKTEGNEIGPELGTVAAKPTEQLTEAILDPNRAVEMRYLAHTVTLKDGKQLVGVIAEETVNSITLKLGAITEVILRSNIARTEATTKSLMPEGLESLLTPQQMADLIAWLRAK